MPLAIELPTTTTLCGANAERPMLLGVYWGYISMMEGLIGRMKSEIGKSITVIATGSIATLAQERLILNGDTERSASA